MRIWVFVVAFALTIGAIINVLFAADYHRGFFCLALAFLIMKIEERFDHP